ncbi:hypothetical protein L1049_024160 [Liquidambar formosana]|uniref:Nudix hydrolase domain-containing protein n=1 Tax=Liquidambar formosana TaxID=63359 RepID=A0AAP0X4C4_LIQFO
MKHCIGTLSSFSCSAVSKGIKISAVAQNFVRRFMAPSPNSLLAVKQDVPEIKQNELPNARDDGYGGVRVQMKDPMDSKVFASLLKASLSKWRQQGKRGVWIELPLKLANLVEAAVTEGFWYHHAEPDYLMLAYWIPKTVNTLPANASHRVGIGAFVVNSKREVLVVQEKSGPFKGTGVWKMPTGVVNEGEDIWRGAEREVKEETGIETKFVEILAFRQSHESFFRKSDLFFVCVLEPLSFDIQKQDQEILAAKWMPVEEYAAQPFVQKNEIFNYVAKICLAKTDEDYTGFSKVTIHKASGKNNDLYFNKRDLKKGYL